LNKVFYIAVVSVQLNGLIHDGGSLNELMKPTRFDVDLSFPKAAKQFKHWFRVFTDFAQKCDQIASAQDADVPDKLRMLFAYIRANMYEIIEDCADYETALTKLKEFM